MNTSAYKMRFKKIIIALLLANIAQFSYGGSVICYGADGHIAIEFPAEKGCCKKNDPNQSLRLITHFDLDHCVDIPIAAQKYIVSTSHTAPVYNCVIPPCIVSLSLFSMSRTFGIAYRRDIPSSHNPQSAILKSVVLLI